MGFEGIWSPWCRFLIQLLIPLMWLCCVCVFHGVTLCVCVCMMMLSTGISFHNAVHAPCDVYNRSVRSCSWKRFVIMQMMCFIIYVTHTRYQQQKHNSGHHFHCVLLVCSGTMFSLPPPEENSKNILQMNSSSSCVWICDFTCFQFVFHPP